jgi:hypothetical protein
LSFGCENGQRAFAETSQRTYLRSSLTFPFRNCLSNEIQIFLIECCLFLLALVSSAFPASLFTFLRLLIIVIYDKSLADLRDRQYQAPAGIRGPTYGTSSLLIVVVLFFLTRVIHIPILSCLARSPLASFFIERLILILLVVKLGLP